MSSKISRQAQLRAEQEKKRKQQQYLLIGGGAVAVVVILAAAFLLLNPPRNATSTGGSAPCANLRTMEDEGRGHLSPGDSIPAYKSVPPTSGTHNPVWYPAGVYDNNADVTQLLHSLEHGYVILYYNGVSQDELNQLINIQRSDSFKVIVAPYPNMPYRVALAAWTKLQTCDGVNEQAIRSFTAQFRNQGPEQSP
jgi:hypothetical protein